MTQYRLWTIALATVVALGIAPSLPGFQQGPQTAPPTGTAGGGGGIGPERTGSQQPLPPGGVFSISGATAPRVLSKVEPQYDPEARAAGIEGEVWLSVVIDENGVPTQIQVTRPLHPGLDAAAIKAVSQWRFRPSVKDGGNVAIRATIAVSFHLGPPPRPVINQKYLPKN